MAFITLPFPTFVANTTILPAQVNSNNAAIVTQVNGGLDNTNISSGAAIAVSKLGLSPGGPAINLTTTGGHTWGSGLTTDANPQIVMTADKGLQFGPGGSTAPDVLLIRSAASTLQLNIPGGGTGTFDMNNGTLKNVTLSNYTLGSALPVSGGGTGATTLTGVLIGNGTSAVTALAPLTVAHGGTGAATLTGALVGNGTGAITGGTLSVGNGGTGATTLASGSLLTGAGTSAVTTTLFTFGTATFAASGSVSVADTTVTSSSVYVITVKGSSPLAEEFSYATTAGTGVVFHSTNPSSTAVIGFIRVA
jgi:hypothetical protein